MQSNRKYIYVSEKTLIYMLSCRNASNYHHLFTTLVIWSCVIVVTIKLSHWSCLIVVTQTPNSSNSGGINECRLNLQVPDSFY